MIIMNNGSIWICEIQSEKFARFTAMQGDHNDDDYDLLEDCSGGEHEHDHQSQLKLGQLCSYPIIHLQ